VISILDIFSDLKIVRSRVNIDELTSRSSPGSGPSQARQRSLRWLGLWPEESQAPIRSSQALGITRLQTVFGILGEDEYLEVLIINSQGDSHQGNVE
jgi:hypothetical protein